MFPFGELYYVTAMSKETVTKKSKTSWKSKGRQAVLPPCSGVVLAPALLKPAAADGFRLGGLLHSTDDTAAGIVFPRRPRAQVLGRM
mmetsp:Transcript_76504/g.151386  ORF Transcript_76504/g.151386 Transcript_76504/m.151386 type:complete len:87 (+) Transcript_76504:123-383(+)